MQRLAFRPTDVDDSKRMKTWRCPAGDADYGKMQYLPSANSQLSKRLVHLHLSLRQRHHQQQQQQQQWCVRRDKRCHKADQLSAF